MARTLHPNSMANLSKGRGKPKYGEPKKDRYLSVTETGWTGLSDVLNRSNCDSVSDLLEKLGRGELLVSFSKV